MKLSRFTVTLYVLLVFVSGIALGAFGHRLYTVSSVSANPHPGPPEEWRKRYMNEMQTRLTLKPDQIKTLESILDETRVRFHEVRERTRPEFDAIRREQVEKIKAMLSDPQRSEYDKMRAEREAKEKAAGRLPGPGF